MRILVVEDEKKIASFIRRGLKEARYVVDLAYDGENALFLAETNPYDLIILDIMLPGEDGLSVCRKLRKQEIDTPVLILTAKDGVRDTVVGLDCGADDYLAKPFAFSEFLARVRALLRRNRKQKTSLLKFEDLELDQLTRQLRRCGKPIPLTAKEYALLEYFMLNPTEVITRTMISEHVWNEDFDSFSNVIDVHINNLRKKINSGFKTNLISSIRGVGYILKM